jgi:ubiquinone/menaquinone biosynthesis C-methylase UbiE
LYSKVTYGCLHSLTEAGMDANLNSQTTQPLEGRASIEWQLGQEQAIRYEQILVPSILGPAAKALVEWADVQVGEAVLDVGCGTGSAARFAADRTGPSGRITGIDINAGMIAVAEGLPRADSVAMEWLVESAYKLSMNSDTIDLVLCAQTLQFLKERQLALAEIRRVLKPGGRAALSVWSELDESPYFQALVESISKYINRETAAGLAAAFSLSEATDIRQLVKDIEFRNIEITARQLDLTLPPLHKFVPQHIQATPMAASYYAAPISVQKTVIKEVTEQLTAYITEQGACVPFMTHLVLAYK